MNNTWHRTRLAWLSLLLLAGCGGPAPSVPMPPPSAPSGAQSTVLLSVTSDANQQPQAVDMAMKLAGFSLEEGRQVVMFFNVKGVTIPVNDFPGDFAYQDNQPIKAQILDLIERGVDVHVCPICMKSLDVQEADLIEGAKVTTRPSLFANIGPNTAVFTY